MKEFEVVITQPAAQDLGDILSYISKELREPVIAKNLIGRMREAIMSLQQLPERNALVSDERLASQGIRTLLVENYIVFYVISHQAPTVTVLRILYNRRDWESL